MSPRLNGSRFAVAKERVEDREEVIGDTGDGLATVHANVFAVDGHAFEQRLNALAATVCDADSYTKQQWRADAMGALAAGAERLRCQCGKSDCPVGGGLRRSHRPAPGGRAGDHRRDVRQAGVCSLRQVGRVRPLRGT